MADTFLTKLANCSEYCPIFIDFTTAPTYDFMQEILSHGASVEVLSPAHLREAVLQQAEAIVARK